MTNNDKEAARQFVAECRKMDVATPPHFELWENAEGVKWIAITAGKPPRQVMYARMLKGADEAEQVAALLSLKREVESILKQ